MMDSKFLVLFLCFVCGGMSCHAIGGGSTKRVTSFLKEHSSVTLHFFQAISNGDIEKVKKQISEKRSIVHIPRRLLLKNCIQNYPSLAPMLQKIKHSVQVCIYPIFLAVCCKNKDIVSVLLKALVRTCYGICTKSFSAPYPIFFQYDFDEVLTPLIAATLYNCIDIVKMLWDYNRASMAKETLQNELNNALYYAVRYSSIEIISFLLKQGADVNHCSIMLSFYTEQEVWFESVLAHGIQRGCTDVVNLLLNVENINLDQGVKIRNTTVLLSRKKYWLKLQKLYTPFINAVQSKHSVVMLDFLHQHHVAKGMIPSHPSDIAYAMRAAILSQNTASVAWLLKKWPKSINWQAPLLYDVDRAPFGISPIATALIKPINQRLTWDLLTAGADINVMSWKSSCKNIGTILPLQYAQQLIEKQKILDEHIFLCACRTQNVVMMYHMLKEDATVVSRALHASPDGQYNIMDMHMFDDEKNNMDVLFFPLFIAAKHGNVDTIKQLFCYKASVQHGIKIISSDKCDFNVSRMELLYVPLVIASFYGHKEAVSVLLEHKYICDVYLFACLAAIKQDHMEIAEMLLSFFQDDCQ